MAQCLMLLESDPDREWFSQIYRDNFRRMSALAVRLLGPGPKAEDAVHDAFLKLIHHSEQLRDWSPERTGAWLAVVVKNTALDMLRVKSGRQSWMSRSGCRLFRRMRAVFRRWWL